MNRFHQVLSSIGCLLIVLFLAACGTTGSPLQNPTPPASVSTTTAIPAGTAPAVTATAPTVPASEPTVSASEPITASGDASTPLQVTLALSRQPQLGEEVDATLTVSTARAVPQVTATLILPAGVVVTSGETDWLGDLVPDQPVVLQSRLRFEAEGNLELSGQARHMFENGDIWADLATIYLTVPGPHQTPMVDTPTPPPAEPAS